MVWIFMFICAAFTFAATSTDRFIIGGVASNIYKNAPYQTETFYVIMSILCLLMTTSFMNATANRDFQYGMQQFVFSSPVKKRDYFFGKFIGATIISVIPMIGLSIGTLIAPFFAVLFNWSPAERYGEVYWSAHLHGLLSFGIPNVIISGVLLFSLAIIFRSTIISFVGSMLLLVFYIVSKQFTEDIHNEWIANLLDPFGVRPFNIMSKYMTPDEKNFHVITLSGDLLINRLVWLGITLLILLLVYSRFSFNSKNEKVAKLKLKKTTPQPILTSNFNKQPTKAGVFSWNGFIHLVKFETKTIIKNPVFIIIMVIGLILLIVNLCTLTSSFGTTRYPVTYIVVDNIEDAYFLFMIGFITFYTGVLVWKERDAKLNEIQDATPIKTGMLFASKVIAIMIAISIVLVCSILLGMLAQTAYGYSRYELVVYVKSLLVIRLAGYLFLTVLSLLFHYLINNRYIAYFAFVAFIMVNLFIWSLMEISTNMLSFGSRPNITYSDMNGFGPFVPGTVWFTIYWLLFSLILCYVIVLFYTRGKEEQFRYRWNNAKVRFGENKIGIFVSILLFVLCGSFVFYNTQILNTYNDSKSKETAAVDYEKAYKKFENLVQPRFYKMNYNIDIMPEQRSVIISVAAWAHNISDTPINELHFTMPDLDSIKLNVPGAKLQSNDKRLHYRIYKLDKPLAKNDSIKIGINVWQFSRGFENEVSLTELTQNGTFFNNQSFLPSFGYNNGMEISDKNKRAELKLPKRIRMPKLDDNNRVARSNTYISNDSDWVNVTTTISTSSDQIAIAPGSLIKSWNANGRKYFQYQLDQKALNFYSFISAKYEVARKKWNGIDLEVYYDKQHAYNVPNMLNSMQKSLEYYTKNFGPYYQKQCRIIEFPRYQNFAQAFPGTMPYSESIGFINDQREVTKDDIDMVFYVVAHEMGHQYWAHQVCGANMQGSEMMSEGFAQYSALMVMEKEYGKDKMKKFLQYEMDDYLNGRSLESEGENPLMKTENQQYIHYNKASVVMYYLKEMVGEKNVNSAMQNLITEYAYKNPPYATSNAAIAEFRKVTPDSLKYLISDMFENITLFSNRMLETTYKKTTAGYEVTMKITCEKFRSDALGKEQQIAVGDYIDIGIFAAPENDKNLGKVLFYKRMKITKKDNTFKFTTKELPYQAGIDPYNYLIDRVPDDNLKVVTEQ